jgi:hypothetical protein
LKLCIDIFIIYQCRNPVHVNFLNVKMLVLLWTWRTITRSDMVIRKAVQFDNNSKRNRNASLQPSINPIVNTNQIWPLDIAVVHQVHQSSHFLTELSTFSLSICILDVHAQENILSMVISFLTKMAYSSKKFLALFE